MDILKSAYTEITEGQTGLQVANILNSELAITYGVTQYDITQTDVSDYSVIYAHDKNTKKLFPTLYDNNWIKQPLHGIFQVIDANTWKLTVDSEIVGTYHLIIYYRP